MGTGIIVVLSRGRFGISNNWEIYGNVFVGEGGRPYNCTDGSIAVINKQEANNWKIYNNSFVNLHGAFRQTGISFSESSGGGHEIYNNLWYNCEKVRYTYSGKGANDYSYFINCISYPIENHWQTGIQDPFVDPRNLNFSLRHATDPGKADLGLSYRTDPIGRIRGADSNWDRGAYEYMPPTSHGGFSSNNRALLYDAAGVAQYDTRAN
jgi:hypothetical protein